MESQDPYPPRWDSIEEVERFIRAAETDPSVSPYECGAIPPSVCEVTEVGIVNVTNPAWLAARYELTFCVDRPDASTITDNKQEGGELPE